MKQNEHKLQVAFVNWFRMQYNQYSGLMWATPNGGMRNVKVATKLKREGVLSGVADLFLAVPRYADDGEILMDTPGLFIELKIKGNYQNENQKRFQKDVEKQSYRYEVCYSLDEFMKVVNGYLETN